MGRIVIRHGREVYLDGRSIGFAEKKADDERWFAVAPNRSVLGIFTDRLKCIRCLCFPPPADDETTANLLSSWIPRELRAHNGRGLFERM